MARIFDSDKSGKVESLLAKVEKQKLTLGINKNVVERAKEAGINISEITEQLLTTMTFRPKGNTHADVVIAFQSFLDALSNILDKYGTSIAVGEVTYSRGPDEEPDDPTNESEEKWTYYLSGYGLSMEGIKVWEDGHQKSLLSKGKVDINSLIPHIYDPKKILENLIMALTRAAESNKERLAQLDFARRLVQTLNEENKGR